jgi:hypothetical protein
MPRMQLPESKLDAYRRKLSERPDRIGILSEGDSWFAFPLPSRPNLIDVLIGRYSTKAAWLRLEGNGDEARSMLSGDQWERMFSILSDPKVRIDLLLFSAGGNDLVGRCLLPLLEQREPSMTWQDCIAEDRFQRRLDQIESAYRELLSLRDDYQPDAWVFTHDYDLAIPGDRPIRAAGMKLGPWMKPYLQQRGIVSPDEQRAIMGFMLERFSRMLRKLEQSYDRFCLVRTQGTLAEDEWGDEIHPTKGGFEKVAAKFQAAIASRFPQLPSP